jgi:GT2 family glycosyltransferase
MIIIVDDASDVPVDSADYEDVMVIRSDNNVGFPIACNMGIALARRFTPEFVCILNNDTIVPREWLSHMIAHMKIGVGLVGPRSNFTSGPQFYPIQDYEGEKGFYMRADEFYWEHKGKSKLHHRLVAFCLLLRTTVFDKVGTFDPQFSPGNYEDDDLCLRAIEAGFKCVIAEDVFIHHFGSQTFSKSGDAYTELMEKNQEKFSAKWGKDRYDELVLINAGGTNE